MIFNDGEIEKTITGHIYKRSFFEEDERLIFTLTLYNPSPNTELGENNDLIIYYYDDDLNMNDAYYS